MGRYICLCVRACTRVVCIYICLSHSAYVPALVCVSVCVCAPLWMSARDCLNMCVICCVRAHMWVCACVFTTYTLFLFHTTVKKPFAPTKWQKIQHRQMILFLSLQSESPLMIRPFLKDMTRSELHAICTGGFATIAGSVLGAYISFGVFHCFLFM